MSFPALIWVGRDPLLANATNTVALVPGVAASMLAFRRELKGSRKFALFLIGPSLVGGSAGALLLLHTPSRLFSSIAPYMILGATLLLASRGPITKLINSKTKPGSKELGLGPAALDGAVGVGGVGGLENYAGDAAAISGPHPTPSRAWWAGAVAFQFLVSIYGGYFGAGIGILMLASLSLLGLTDIYQIGGLKNFLGVCINATAAILFIVSGAVIWRDVFVMAIGAAAGGYGGVGLARKVGPVVVRRAVIFIGLGMGLSLFFFHR